MVALGLLPDSSVWRSLAGVGGYVAHNDALFGVSRLREALRIRRWHAGVVALSRCA
jgi:hypothetical protein